MGLCNLLSIRPKHNNLGISDKLIKQLGAYSTSVMVNYCDLVNAGLEHDSKIVRAYALRLNSAQSLLKEHKESRTTSFNPEERDLVRKVIKDFRRIHPRRRSNKL